MRIVQFLLTALAVLVAIIGGVFTMMVAAVTVLVVFVSRRLLGQRRSALSLAGRRSVTSRRAAADAIDISAREISDSR